MMLQNCFQSYFDQLPLFLRNDKKFDYYTKIVLQFGTMAEIIRGDLIDELKQFYIMPVNQEMNIL